MIYEYKEYRQKDRKTHLIEGQGTGIYIDFRVGVYNDLVHRVGMRHTHPGKTRRPVVMAHVGMVSPRNHEVGDDEPSRSVQ